MAEPTYRMSMLPFGTYPNEDGNGEHLGFAVPGMIEEPLNALSRLFGTPSNPGTFAQGPDAPGNADAMRTLLLSTYGGNALNPGRLLEGAAAKAATHDAQMARSLTAAYPGEDAVMTHLPSDMWQSVAETNVNPGLTGSGFNRALAASSGYDFGAANAVGKVPLDAYERAALDQAWRNKVRTTGELFSDTGKPSLWGSSLSQPYQDEPRNSLLTY